MALFGRKRNPGYRLPDNFVQQMKEFGDLTMNDRATADTYPRYIAPYFDWSYADPDNFATAVADAVVGQDPIAVYGAERLVENFVGGDSRTGGYLRLLDAYLDWQHERGGSSAMLTGHQMNRWIQTNEGGW